MKKVLEVLLSRGFIIIFSLLVQIGLWVLLFSLFSSYISLIFLLMSLLSIYCTIYIIIQDINPEAKIAWIIFMVLFPIAGGVFYLVFGSHRISKRRFLFSKQIESNKLDYLSNIKEPFVSKLSLSSVRNYTYLRGVALSPAFNNTQIKYFKVGEEKFEAMLQELENAKKFIFIEYFIIEKGKMWDSIEEILIRKAAEGVDVRILYDDLGCLLTLPFGFSRKMKKLGIDCRPFNKIMHFANANFNNRDHRKICVIDGNVGFNGGINLADEYINEKVKYGHWKDTAILLKGDAVFGLTMMFLSMWELQTKRIEDYYKYLPTVKEKSDGLVQPFADTPLDKESVGASVYMNILNSAKDYVYITSPYLIINKEMITSLVNAAKSGIDVRIVLPKIPDKKLVQFLSRSYYNILLSSGVRIYEYTEGFIHSKMFISDDNLAVVGTINLDYRSLDLHYECGTVMYESSVINEIHDDFVDTMEKSLEIVLDSKKKKIGFFKFILLGILRTFSPLL